jgi:hypothetical protein
LSSVRSREDPPFLAEMPCGGHRIHTPARKSPTLSHSPGLMSWHPDAAYKPVGSTPTSATIFRGAKAQTSHDGYNGPGCASDRFRPDPRGGLPVPPPANSRRTRIAWSQTPERRQTEDERDPARNASSEASGFESPRGVAATSVGRTSHARSTCGNSSVGRAQV